MKAVQWIFALGFYQQAELFGIFIVPFVILFVGLWWRRGKIIIEVIDGQNSVEHDNIDVVVFRVLNSTNNSVQITTCGFVAKSGELMEADSWFQWIVDAHKHSPDGIFEKVDLFHKAKYPLRLWAKDIIGKIYYSKPFKFKVVTNERYNVP